MALLMYGVFRGDKARAQRVMACRRRDFDYGDRHFQSVGQRTGRLQGAVHRRPVLGLHEMADPSGSALAVLMSLNYNEREGIQRFEYPVLILFATLGMLLMVSANDLMSLYVGWSCKACRSM